MSTESDEESDTDWGAISFEPLNKIAKRTPSSNREISPATLQSSEEGTYSSTGTRKEKTAPETCIVAL